MTLVDCKWRGKIQRHQQPLSRDRGLRKDPDEWNITQLSRGKKAVPGYNQKSANIKSTARNHTNHLTSHLLRTLHSGLGLPWHVKNIA
jgi:hypothetical protein